MKQPAPKPKPKTQLTPSLMHLGLKQVLTIALSTLKPPPDLLVSAWADQYRYLTSTSSNYAGRWNTNRFPYQRALMDAWNEPGLSHLVIVAGSQVGKSEVLLNIMGHDIHLDPCPMMMVQPTLEMAAQFSKDRFDTMAAATPVLRDAVAPAKSGSSDNTTRRKSFTKSNSGYLVFIGANSAAALRSRPIKRLFMDETEAYPADVEGEGDPIALAKARTKRFPGSKTAEVSTPSNLSTSRIWPAFLNGDQRYFYIPCPDCDHYQPLVWEQVKWEKDEQNRHLPRTASYECRACHYKLNDAERKRAIKRYKVFATADFTDTASFHISELYAADSLSDLVTQFIRAKALGPIGLKTFMNHQLALPWEDSYKKLDTSVLLERLESYKGNVPEGSLVITAGVDVQDNRLVCEVVGWNRTTSWSLDWRTFYGIPTPDSPVWNELDAYLAKSWPSVNGPDVRISSTFIDMGGHYTDPVYQFCAPRARRRIYPCKGSSQASHPLVARSKTMHQDNQLWLVGTGTAKGLVNAYLQVEHPNQPGYCHFGAGINDDDYFTQLTAEELQRVYKNGQWVDAWKPKQGVRNEALDCRVYAMAALEALNVDWASVEQHTQRLRATHNQRGANASQRLTQSIPPAPKHGAIHGVFLPSQQTQNMTKRPTPPGQRRTGSIKF